ncbi:uncharacterized protein LOC113215117 isoform X1 [Frankliniella occidentalis]|uniref:Uncharacterized protein LOC113215117 isoform X1 n=1 Tax=Frankliniella occidentalis TaxID=133901 RepID=A0A9C6TYA2_FRAOC|nr:uncharacterized protein LOC113215117 isoform X1 [Frankliniella occidentalis]
MSSPRTMAFPYLFPTGRSGCTTKIHTADYFKFLMEYSDRRFSCHPTFRFFALNSMMRWNALTNGRVFIRNNPRFNDMTAADLRRRIRAGERNILKQALYHGNKLKGTRHAADLHWSDFFRLVSPGEDFETMTETRRQQLLCENPHIADTFFAERTKFFIRNVFKVKYNVKDYWFRFEYQHRGSPHVHCIVYLDGAPDVSNLKDASQEHLNAVIRYFDSLVSTMNPGKDLPPADIHPCRKKFSEVTG